MTTFPAQHRGGRGSPLVLLHGFIDNLRTWDLVRDELERHHEVLSLALPGHAGGVPLPADVSADWIVDQLEAALDAAGFDTVHLAGNSLGGYLALALAARGRARSVVALAPAGGWAPDDSSDRAVLATLGGLYTQAQALAPHADALVAEPAGRRQATALITTHYAHIPAELLAHQIRAIAATDGAEALIALVGREGWNVDASAISCPLAMVWGSADKVLPWPRAAVAYQAQFPAAEWVLLEGIGHCPQLDDPDATARVILGLTA